MIKTTQTLINKNKDNFIIVSELNKIKHVISTFNIINKKSNPGLTVDINRYVRCQNLMKTIPRIFKMKSDGDQIEIDVINRVFEFDIENLTGILNYSILSEDPLITKINSIYQENENSQIINFIVDPLDDVKVVPKTLKTFPCICYNGLLLCITDTIEKVLHTSILDPSTGLLGITSESEYKSAITICKAWPELDIKINIKDSNLEIYSEQLIHPEYLKPGIINLHRNFGNNNISISQTHLLLEDNETIPYHTSIKEDIIVILLVNKKYQIHYLENINTITNNETLLEEIPAKSSTRLIERLKNYIKEYNPKYNLKFI